MTQQAKKRLGRGLAALIGDDRSEENFVEDMKGLRRIPIDRIKASPNNPRKEFTKDELGELSESIRNKGILQPVVVRSAPNEDNLFEIIAGERRWRAAQMVNTIHEIPALVRDFDDDEMLEIALIENIQRSDLNPLEECDGYKKLLSKYSYKQEELAKTIGKSRSYVSNILRLANLPNTIKDYLKNGHLSYGHARALIGLPHKLAEEAAKRIISNDLSVRQTENLVKSLRNNIKKDDDSVVNNITNIKQKDPDTIALEKSLRDTLGLKVNINYKADKGGTLTISYKSLEQLDDICSKLGRVN